MWPQDFISHSSIPGYPVLPWGRGRMEKLPPRNSAVVIQKTKIRDLETECQRHQAPGKQTEAAEEFKREN